MKQDLHQERARPRAGGSGIIAIYEITHDKVRIAAGDPRQWLVWVDGRLRAECVSEQQAKDCIAIFEAKKER